MRTTCVQLCADTCTLEHLLEWSSELHETPVYKPHNSVKHQDISEVHGYITPTAKTICYRKLKEYPSFLQ